MVSKRHLVSVTIGRTHSVDEISTTAITKTERGVSHLSWALVLQIHLDILHEGRLN